MPKELDGFRCLLFLLASKISFFPIVAGGLLFLACKFFELQILVISKSLICYQCLIISMVYFVP